MHWIAENWLTLLLVAGMLALHMFGHGHGGHGGHGKHGGRKRERQLDAEEGKDGTSEGRTDEGRA